MSHAVQLSPAAPTFPICHLPSSASAGRVTERGPPTPRCTLWANGEPTPTVTPGFRFIPGRLAGPLSGQEQQPHHGGERCAHAEVHIPDPRPACVEAGERDADREQQQEPCAGRSGTTSGCRSRVPPARSRRPRASGAARRTRAWPPAWRPSRPVPAGTRTASAALNGCWKAAHQVVLSAWDRGDLVQVPAGLLGLGPRVPGAGARRQVDLVGRGPGEGQAGFRGAGQARPGGPREGHHGQRRDQEAGVRAHHPRDGCQQRGAPPPAAHRGMPCGDRERQEQSSPRSRP